LITLDNKTKIFSLEDKIKAGLFPQCPVNRLMQEKTMRCEKLVIYGLASNFCPDCNSKGYDQDCQLYQDWLAKQYLLEKENEQCQS